MQGWCVAGLIWRAWIFGASGVPGGWMMRHCIRFKISDSMLFLRGGRGALYMRVMVLLSEVGLGLPGNLWSGVSPEDGDFARMCPFWA